MTAPAYGAVPLSLICGLLLTFMTAERFDSRVSAHEFWASLGPLAWPVLSSGAFSPDPETRYQSRRLLARCPMWYGTTLVATRPWVVGDLLGLGPRIHETWSGDDQAAVLLVCRVLGVKDCPLGAGNEYLKLAVENEVVSKVQPELRAIRRRK